MLSPHLRSCSRSLTALMVMPLFGFSQLVSAQVYSAGFSDAKWAAQTGAFACSLTHEIPGYGNARFTRNTGTTETLELRYKTRAFPAGNVLIESIPPMWRTEDSPAVLGQTQASGKSPLKVTSSLDAITKTLEQGSSVVFSSGSGDSSLRVGLEGRNFSPAFAQYRKCVTNLIPYTFNQISRTIIFYGRNADALSATAKTQLDTVIRYVKADPKVLGIIVDAHSDKLENPEDAEHQSQVQAELITQYLIDKGVGSNKITPRWHGEKFPIAGNNDKAGQAKNRRVTVRLENETTRKEMEKKIAAIKLAEQKAEQEALAKAATQTASSASNEPKPISVQRLEEMVERQNLGSGKQPVGELMR